MLTSNDSKFATVVDDETIVVDFRKNKAQLPTQAGQARMILARHLYGDVGIGDLWARNDINAYHVQSVHKKMWVASRRTLQPSDTRAMVEKVLT